jgi:hypothetical protein
MQPPSGVLRLLGQEIVSRDKTAVSSRSRSASIEAPFVVDDVSEHCRLRPCCLKNLRNHVHRRGINHLDGKLDASKPSAVADRVTTAIDALLTATSIAGHSVHPQ